VRACDLSPGLPVRICRGSAQRARTARDGVVVTVGRGVAVVDVDGRRYRVALQRLRAASGASDMGAGARPTG